MASQQAEPLADSPDSPRRKKGAYLFEANEALQCCLRDTKMSVYLFCIFASRLLLTPLWTINHIPFVSPVYWQGHHWIASTARTAAILLHIVFGVIMLCVGIFQLQRDVDPATVDNKLIELFPSRTPCLQRSRRWHKVLGRIYVVSGLIVVGTLQVLTPTMGQGVSEGPSLALIAMAQTCTALWVLAVVAALVFIRLGRLDPHRRLMRLSYAVALTPMTQRFMHFVMVPAAIVVVLLVEVAQGEYMWPNTTDLIWSMEGYGRADEAMLPVSAWTGLTVNLVLFAADDRRKRQQTLRVQSQEEEEEEEKREEGTAQEEEGLELREASSFPPSQGNLNNKTDTF